MISFDGRVDEIKPICIWWQQSTAIRFLARSSKSSTTPRRINEGDDEWEHVEWEDGDSDEREEEDVDAYESNDDDED